MLNRIQISNFRNITTQLVSDLSAVNVFVGENGAGKTSMLESIYTLGHGRSFRKQGGQRDALVRYGADRLVVFGEQTVWGGSSSAEELVLGKDRIGLSRAVNGDIQIKINGEKVHRVSEVALRLPMVALNADTFDLLTGGAGERRRYLDWLVFHVEHTFREVSRRYTNALQQRNAVLRAIVKSNKASGAKGDRGPGVKGEGDPHLSQIEVWTKTVSELGEYVSDLRSRQFAQINRLFFDVLHQLGGDVLGLELRYRQGWAQGQSLEEALASGLETDMARGFTQFGPHRAEIQVVVGKDVAGQARLARDVLSRGQLKLVVLAMKLAQIRFFQGLSNERGAAKGGVTIGVDGSLAPRKPAKRAAGNLYLLLDDIAAELDQPKLAVVGRVLSEFAEAGSLQVFATATTRAILDPMLSAFCGVSTRVFHVEQGAIVDIE